MLTALVWNMEHKPHWSALDRLEPDVALLNEAVVPDDRAATWMPRVTTGRDGKLRPWTSAVLSPHELAPVDDAKPVYRGRARNVPFASSRAGAWVAAVVQVPGWPPITAVSLYGLLDELSDASVHRSLSELSPLVDDPRYSKYLLLGGDLNTGTQWPSNDRFLARDANVLGRLSALGLVDCVAARRPAGRLHGCVCGFADACTHVRTRRDRRKPEVPYQTDYLFASPALERRLVSAEVLVTDEWFALSDHAPILATFA